MRAVLIYLLLVAVLSSDAAAAGVQAADRQAQQAAVTAPKPEAAAAAPEFERVRAEGNDALYNTDYDKAGQAYLRLTRLEPDNPAGWVYLANTVWLETLFLSRRLSTTLYAGGSFYSEDSKGDKVDPKRTEQFNKYLDQAIKLTKERLKKNPNDAEALYYQAAALGLGAGYQTTVKRSFFGAIGDANRSIKLQRQVIKLDPNYVDAYLSIGLYEYVIDSLPLFYRVLARVAGLRGSKKKGIELLEMVTQKGKYTQDDARVLLIGIYTRERKPDRALEIISYLAKRYPRNYLFGVEQANMLYRMGRPDEGDKAFAALLKEGRITETALDIVYSQWGDALMTNGKHAAAVEQYNEVKRWPKSEAGLVSLAHLRTAQAYESLGKSAEAVAEYETVRKRENIYDSHKQADERLKALRPPQPKKK